MGHIRLIYRSIFTFTVLIVGIVLTPVVQGESIKRKGLGARINSTWHSLLARALGISVDVHGEANDEATLYIANHISWFDIHALASHLPVRFLSKDEVRTWPLIGWLASKAGTLYIKRGAHASQDAIKTMADVLATDQNVCLFAEGTTTDGHLRRFHGRLVQSAIEAGCSVQPVALFYPPEAHHQNRLAHPDMLYIGDTSLAQSLIWILRSPRLRAEIHLLEIIDTSGMSRKEIAQACEAAVRTKLHSLAGVEPGERMEPE